jgi:antitoxin (DNA-binding transcriptional repressor) of toxin-antitoxin stability system
MATKPVNIYDFKTSLSKYSKQVLKGASIIVSIRNKPFAEFRPLSSESILPFKYGVLQSELKDFEIPADFNDPLTDFEEDFYGVKR